MALIEIILKPISRKIANNILEKNEAKKEAIARGEIPPDGPKVSVFKDFYSLDDKKTRGQAIVTLFFFMLVTSAMDAVIFMPFAGNEDAAEIMSYVERLPPSLFVGIALTILVMVGRDVPTWKKVLMAGISVWGGYGIGSFVAVLPIVHLLQQPLAGEIKIDTEEADNAQPDAVVSPPEPVAEETQQVEPETVSEPELEPEAEAEPEVKSESEAPPSRPMGDGEVPDDFVDPIDAFLKKD